MASSSIASNLNYVSLKYTNFTSEPNTTVPEPTTVGMIGTASALLLFRMPRSK